VGLFRNPVAIATAMGLGTAALLAGGWALIRFTRYQLTGRALALLACLVMPLNLWFYHTQGLVTLEGNLWVAAVVCCVLYAASALVLRDSLFVYVFVGGVALTGLLLLADRDVDRFHEIAAPATLLVVLGLLCIHVERVFPEALPPSPPTPLPQGERGESAPPTPLSQGERGEPALDAGPFTRRGFGLAFFWSGHALLAAGLLLLLGAQVAGGWLYEPLFKPVYDSWQAGQPQVVTEPWGRMLALGLVLAGLYAYFYSDLVVRRIGVYVYLGVFCLLWAEVLLAGLLEIEITPEVVILVLALTALAANLVQPLVADPRSPVSRAGQPLGFFLSTLPVLLGLILHLRATYRPLHEIWPYEAGWSFVAAMLVTAVSCRIGAFLYRHTVPWLCTLYFFGTAAATLIGAAALLAVLDLKTWADQAPLLMLIPIAYLVAARLYQGQPSEQPLVWVAHTATAVMVVAVVAAALRLTPEHVFEVEAGQALNLSLAAFFVEATLFYVLAAAFRQQGANVYLATLMACGALWQILKFFHVPDEFYTLAFAVLGFGLLVGYRFAAYPPLTPPYEGGEGRGSGLAEEAFQCANALMSLSFVSSVFLALRQLAAHRIRDWSHDWPTALLLLALVVLGFLAAALVSHPGWRRWYVLMALTEGVLLLIVLHVLADLTPWQKLELFSVLIGLGLLLSGHLGWYREQDRQNDLVSFSLFLGSLAVGLPLVVELLLHRGHAEFALVYELGTLLAGVLLLGSGFMFRLKSTTLTGLFLVVLYLVTLPMFLRTPDVLQSAAVLMLIGGAVLFGTGLLLSLYRDRLLALPLKIKRREGIFRVLSWR
jgi:hypothetical protein